VVARHGSAVQRARERAVAGSFEPMYHEVFQFTATLPGDGRVRLSVMEAGLLPWLDSEIGSTEFDVEDRWFSERWQEQELKPRERRVHARALSLGPRLPPPHPARAAPGRLPPPRSTNDARTPGPILPTLRTPAPSAALSLLSLSRSALPSPPAACPHQSLWREGASVVQGALELWVEVLPLSDALHSPAESIALPAPESFEMRVLLFETRFLRKRGVVGSTDAYMRVALRGHDGAVQLQETDVHWSVVDGAAAFNWRFIFRLTLPLASRRRLDGIYLDVQAWDRSLMGDDELLSGGVVPVSKLCRDAWLSRDWLKSTDSSISIEHGSQRRRRFWVPLVSRGGASEVDTKPAGDVAMSVELMPREVAGKVVAGHGRDPPNRNPVLPEPQRERRRAFTDRITRVIRQEIQVAMRESAQRVFENEIARRRRQITPARLRLLICIGLAVVSIFVGIILLQLLANVLVTTFAFQTGDGVAASDPLESAVADTGGP
jgi:hypothetical protein